MFDPEPKERQEKRDAPISSDTLAVLAATALIGITASFYWIDNKPTIAAFNPPPTTVGQGR